MPQFPLCSEFVPLLDSVKNQLVGLKQISQEYLRSGDKDKQTEFQRKQQVLEETKQKLIDLAEQPAEFEGNSIRRIEKEITEFMRKGLGEDLKYEITGKYVSEIDCCN